MKTNNLLLAIFLFTGLNMGCNNGSNDQKDQENEPVVINPNSKRDIEVIKNHIEGLKTKSLDAAYRNVDKDAPHYGPKLSDKRSNEEDINYWKGVYQTSSDISFGEPYLLSVQVNEGPTEGTWVLAWGTYSALHNETGNKMEFPYHVSYKMDNGKIIASYSYFNELDFLSQLGFELMIPE